MPRPTAAVTGAPVPLVRAIGLGRATAMVVGTIIGASIFVQPSMVSGAGSPRVVLLIWAFAGLLTLIGALVCAELSSAFPSTGGVYVYLRNAYSPALAYLWGWAMFWVMHSGIIAAIATVFARYLGHFVPMGDAGTRIAAVGAIVGLSAVNYFGVRPASALQTFFTLIKVAAVVAIVVMGLSFVVRSDAPWDSGAITLLPGHLAPSLIAGLFAFGGWHMVTYAAEETDNPTRTIPRALMIGTIAVTVAYIAINWAYLAVLPQATVVGSSRVAADFADAVIGRGGADILSVLVILSTLGGMTGIILSGPRVYLAMANDGLLFRWLGALHPQHRTPHVAIILQAVWSSVLVLSGTYRALFTRVVYTEWIFFALMAASLFFLRRRKDYAPAYRLPAYSFWCALFILSSGWIVVDQLISQPKDGLIGLGIVLAGLPVYWIWTRRTPQTADPSSPATRAPGSG